jgi:cytochrome c oxidase subunit 3
LIEKYRKAGVEMSSTTHGSTPYYFVPGPSRHPAMAAFGCCAFSSWARAVDQWGGVGHVFALRVWPGLVAYCLPVVHGFVHSESEGGQYGHKIDLSYRWSMSWFIFSEVMFFGAFFTALWWARAHSVPALGSLDNALLWPEFKAVWPSLPQWVPPPPAGIVEPFTTMGPILAAHHQHRFAADSGVTLTIAHHALVAGNRSKTIAFMWMTVLLGIVFLWCRVTSTTMPTPLNLKLSSGCLWLHLLHADRLSRFPRVCGHADAAVHHPAPAKRPFHAERHFGFEGAAWYWHFVDVVWLGLYILVYWL